MPRRLTPATGVALAALLWLPDGATADSKPAGPEAVDPGAVGRNPAPGPETVVVSPEAAVLTGPRARVRLLVAGRWADGSLRDLTGSAEFAAADGPRVVAVSPDGTVSGVADGTGAVVVRAAGRTVRVAVTVRGSGSPTPPSFRNEVMAVLARTGCSMGACHGKVSGQNGFRLSLRGPFPEDDHPALTRELAGRRVDRTVPADSLLLLKSVGGVPHEGGVRFERDSDEYRLLHDWIAAGMPDDPVGAPKLVGLEVHPAFRVLTEPAWTQHLRVTARYSDGGVRDVTHLAWFSVSDEMLGECSPEGRVTGKRRGQLAVVAHYLTEVAGAGFVFVPDLPDFRFREPPVHNFVDRLVFGKLRQMRLPASDLCTDAEFLRRASLDVCGVLPTPEQTRAFLADPAPDKREKLIDALLERPEYADFWALKWADVLRNSREFFPERAVHRLHRWIRRSIAANVAFDRFAGELLAAAGSTVAHPAANFARATPEPTFAGEAAAQVFLGIRLQCARCHNHPLERWTQDDYYGFAAFFAGVRQKPGRLPDEAVIGHDPARAVTQPRTGRRMTPRFPGGTAPAVPAGADPRPALAAWISDPANPYFARATVNRVWRHLLGRGIIDPVDDIRDSNPACNAELLDALAREFVASGFDLKALIRTVLRSRTYQLSARPVPGNADDEVMFSRAVPRQLTAEQLLDAVCAVTGSPEKFAGLPAGTRAAQIPDTSADVAFLRTFGRPKRQIPCDCERDGDSNLGQVLQLVNGEFLNKKLTAPDNRIGRALADRRSDAEIVAELYLAAFCREPRADELDRAIRHIAASGNRRQGLEDVLWALINSREFLFQH
jgi:hypothetical protein